MSLSLENACKRFQPYTIVIKWKVENKAYENRTKYDNENKNEYVREGFVNEYFFFIYTYLSIYERWNRVALHRSTMDALYLATLV